MPLALVELAIKLLADVESLCVVKESALGFYRGHQLAIQGENPLQWGGARLFALLHTRGAQAAEIEIALRIYLKGEGRKARNQFIWTRNSVQVLSIRIYHLNITSIPLHPN